MADDTDVLLKLCEEQWTQARQSEDQRATITNIVFVVASAIIGLIAQTGLVLQVLPLTILLLVIGIYGAITSEKLYERHQFHMRRAAFWRKRLNELHPNAEIEKYKDQSDARHRTKFPRLNRMRLHYLWLTLHLGIALAGIILTIIITL